MELEEEGYPFLDTEITHHFPIVIYIQYEIFFFFLSKVCHSVATEPSLQHTNLLILVLRHHWISKAHGFQDTILDVRCFTQMLLVTGPRT